MISNSRQFVLVAFVTLLLAGCSATELPIVIYPLPPETPRIQWLGTFGSQDDFTKGGAKVFLEGVAGKPPLATFKSPFGIASDSSGLIYIADPIDSNIRVYDLARKDVNYYSKENYFAQPLGLAVDSADNLYVVDGKLKKVFVFNAARQPIRAIGGPEEMQIPSFVKVDDQRDRVYVSDSKQSKILVYSRAGEKLFEIGPKLTETHHLYNPQGLAIDKDGNLFIAEMLKARITAVTPAGEFLRTFGVRGDAFYQFEAPKDLAFDSDGNLWVADNRRSQIYTYTPTGELLLATGSSSRTDTGALAFSSPTAISVDAKDRVLITDRVNRRFMVWQYRNAAYNAAHPLTAAEKAALDAAGKQLGELKGKESAQP